MSLPIRIALVAVLAIFALWFVALRPKPAEETAAAPSAAPAAGLGGAVDAANDAAATSDAANAKLQEATGGTPTSEAAKPTADGGSAGAAATPPAAKQASADKRDLAAPLLRDLRAGRAVVVLFAARGADDKAARAAVRGVSRRGGDVRVKVVSIGDVAKYEQITTGVQVVQAPTTLVIGPDRQATAITGYTDVAEVEQAVADALAKPEKK